MEVTRKQSTPNFAKFDYFLPLFVRLRIGGVRNRFPENFGVLCFLVTFVLRFAVLPDY